MMVGQRRTHHVCASGSIVGMRCVCPPGCTDQRVGDQGTCAPGCEPCRETAWQRVRDVEADLANILADQTPDTAPVDLFGDDQ